MRSSFDRWMLGAVAIVAVVIGVLVTRGDHVGVQVTRATPEGRAGPGSVITIQFSEAMKRDTVADRLTFEPPLGGAISWTGSRLIYRPSQPFGEGAQYRVVVKSGAEAEGGRVLLHDLRFDFDVVGGRVAYLAPEDETVRDIWIADQSGREPARLTQSAFGVLAFDVSRDGTKIAFAERKGTGASADLKLLDLETNETRALTNCGEFVCTNPVWSPDGTRLAYERPVVQRGRSRILHQLHARVGPGYDNHRARRPSPSGRSDTAKLPAALVARRPARRRRAGSLCCRTATPASWCTTSPTNRRSSFRPASAA